jgi:hypothetical protein
VGSDRLTARSTHCESSAVLQFCRPYGRRSSHYVTQLLIYVGRFFRSLIKSVFILTFQTVLSPYNRIQAAASRSRLSCLRTTVSKQQRLDPDCPVSVQPYPSNSVSIQTVLSPYNRIQAAASRAQIYKILAKFPNSTTPQFL